MPTVFDVAAYVLEKLGPVSHMKLQKLVYYSQAWSLVWDDKPIFPEKIEAWVSGPVVRPLYNQLQGKFQVSREELGQGSPANLTEDQKDTINKVLEFYGGRDAQYLSDLTHMEEPWRQARAGLAAGERGGKEISLASLSEYYSSIRT